MKKTALIAALAFAGLGTTAGATCYSLRQRERAAVNAQAAQQGARVIRCHPGEGGGRSVVSGGIGSTTPNDRDLLCSETRLRIVQSSPDLRVQLCGWTADAHELRNGTTRVGALGGFSCTVIPGNHATQQRTPTSPHAPVRS